MDRKLLRIFLLIGILLIPFTFKREKLKDWMLIFFLKGYISSFIAKVVVRNQNIHYPIRLMPKFFDISIVFDYLLFPILCVVFNRTSLHSKPLSIFLQSLVFSLPMTVIELILERYTDLIKYKKGWNWMITYGSLNATFLFVRLFISNIRKYSIEEEQALSH